MTFTATGSFLTRSFSQVKFDRFVAQHVRSYTKSKIKGHRDWKDVSDEKIKEMALTMARIYNAGEVWS